MCLLGVCGRSPLAPEDVVINSLTGGNKQQLMKNISRFISVQKKGPKHFLLPDSLEELKSFFSVK